MTSLRKLRMILTLAPVCLLAPAMVHAGGPVSPSTDVYRETSGGEPKRRAPGGTLSDAGITRGPSAALRSDGAGTAAKRGVAGGTLHGRLEAEPIAAPAESASLQALRPDAGRGPAKHRPGGAAGEAGPVSGGPRVIHLGEGASALPRSRR